MNKRVAAYLLVLFSALTVSGTAYAHAGGVDEHGCHAKKGVRHCHGEKEGLYIPENEETRIKKLHTATCNQQNPEGYYPKRDLYGKRCNTR